MPYNNVPIIVQTPQVEGLSVHSKCVPEFNTDLNLRLPKQTWGRYDNISHFAIIAMFFTIIFAIQNTVRYSVCYYQVIATSEAINFSLNLRLPQGGKVSWV